METTKIARLAGVDEVVEEVLTGAAIGVVEVDLTEEVIEEVEADLTEADLTEATEEVEGDLIEMIEAVEEDIETIAVEGEVLIAIGIRLAVVEAILEVAVAVVMEIIIGAALGNHSAIGVDAVAVSIRETVLDRTRAKKTRKLSLTNRLQVCLLARNLIHEVPGEKELIQT